MGGAGSVKLPGVGGGPLPAAMAPFPALHLPLTLHNTPSLSAPLPTWLHVQPHSVHGSMRTPPSHMVACAPSMLASR